MALFGNSGSTAAASKNLVEFRCGKMKIKGRIVSADTRKGLLYIHQTEDSLVHLCWKDREKSKVEDDLIIFPDDCEWKKVPQCTTGRVFVLKFNSSLRRIFFWMQEPKEDKDDELCKKVNDSLNNPPPKGGRGGTGGGSGLADLSDALGQGNLQDLFNNVDHQQLLQIMAGGGLGNLLSPVRQSGKSSRTTSNSSSAKPASTPASSTATSQSISTSDSSASRTTAGSAATTTTPSNKSGNNTVKLSQLQDILSNIQKPTTSPIDLSEAITPEAMIPILSDPKVQDRLKPHLPAGSEAFSSGADELRATARSPHFRQAMASFSLALASGQLGPLLAQFGLPKAAQDAANKGDVEEFAKAMQNAAKEGGKTEDQEEQMNVD